MLAPTTEPCTNVDRAKALIPRLEQLNQTVKASAASPQLIETTLKIGVTYAAFLIEVRDGNPSLNTVNVPELLDRTKEHCDLYEIHFSEIAKGAGA